MSRPEGFIVGCRCSKWGCPATKRVKTVAEGEKWLCELCAADLCRHHRPVQPKSLSLGCSLEDFDRIFSEAVAEGWFA